MKCMRILLKIYLDNQIDRAEPTEIGNIELQNAYKSVLLAIQIQFNIMDKFMCGKHL